MVLACSHFQGDRQDHRQMKPSGLAGHYLVCQTCCRWVVDFQYSAPKPRDRAGIWALSVCPTSEDAEAWWCCGQERGHGYGTLLIPKYSSCLKIRCWEGSCHWPESRAQQGSGLCIFREFVQSRVAVMDVARTHSSSLNSDELMSYCGLSCRST